MSFREWLFGTRPLTDRYTFTDADRAKATRMTVRDPKTGKFMNYNDALLMAKQDRVQKHREEQAAALLTAILAGVKAGYDEGRKKAAEEKLLEGKIND